jgi:YegS/Rv2252/BmrU family lipid kinase
MPQNHTKLIINPVANMGKAYLIASDLRAITEEHGGVEWTGTVFPTHATQLAKKAAEEGFKKVVAVGGDGTVHEVINGLMQVPEDKRPVFGIVPVGSGNDFAHQIGMNPNPEFAMKQVLTSTPSRIDLGIIEDEHGRREFFNNTVNIGFGGAVNVYSHTLPLVRGFLMYLTAVILTIIRRYDVLEVKITTDKESWEQESMMMIIANGQREGGGFISAPNAEIDDQILDYTVLSKTSRLMMFRLIPEFMRGTQGKFDKLCRMGRMKKFQIKSKQPLYLHTDGETFAGFASSVYQIKAEIIPSALKIIYPKRL